MSQTASKETLSFEDFKTEVINDYKIAICKPRMQPFRTS